MCAIGKDRILYETDLFDEAGTDYLPFVIDVHDMNDVYLHTLKADYGDGYGGMPWSGTMSACVVPDSHNILVFVVDDNDIDTVQVFTDEGNIFEMPFNFNGTCIMQMLCSDVEKKTIEQ